MQALDFDADDLAANRTGVLTEAQRKRLRAARGRVARIRGGSVLVIGLFATTFLFIGQQNADVVLRLLGITASIFNALLVGLLARSWLRLSADLEAPEVNILSGTLTHTIRVMGRAATYVVTLDGEEVVVSKDAFLAFADKAPYRLYRAPHSLIILSAEAL